MKVEKSCKRTEDYDAEVEAYNKINLKLAENEILLQEVKKKLDAKLVDKIALSFKLFDKTIYYIIKDRCGDEDGIFVRELPTPVGATYVVVDIDSSRDHSIEVMKDAIVDKITENKETRMAQTLACEIK